LEVVHNPPKGVQTMPLLARSRSGCGPPEHRSGRAKAPTEFWEDDVQSSLGLRVLQEGG
jgi:hypothetical protein